MIYISRLLYAGICFTSAVMIATNIAKHDGAPLEFKFVASFAAAVIQAALFVHFVLRAALCWRGK